MDPEVATIRVALGNRHMRLRLLRSMAECSRHVTIAEQPLRLDILLELAEMLRSVADQRLFPLWFNVAAASRSDQSALQQSARAA